DFRRLGIEGGLRGVCRRLPCTGSGQGGGRRRSRYQADARRALQRVPPVDRYRGRMAAPVSRDEELELRIDSLAYGGHGVARLNGFVVFVRRGLPGDVVRARVTNVKRNHAEALALEVVQAGPERVDAPCAHYPACGGCRFQDLAYDAQIAAKEE